jgi:hypothetical protein
MCCTTFVVTPVFAKLFGMTMTHFRSFIFSGLFLVILLHSCVNHDLPNSAVPVCTSVDEISFSADVKPIITQKCAITGCHNGDNGPDKNWTVFNNFQSHSSEVQDRITRPIGAAGHMPRVGSLTNEQIQTIYCWAAQGAKDN